MRWGFLGAVSRQTIEDTRKSTFLTVSCNPSTDTSSLAPDIDWHSNVMYAVHHGVTLGDSQSDSPKLKWGLTSAIDVCGHRPGRLWQIWGLHMYSDRMSKCCCHPHLGLGRQIWSWCLMPCFCHSYFYPQDSWKLRFCCMCHGWWKDQHHLIQFPKPGQDSQNNCESHCKTKDVK